MTALLFFLFNAIYLIYASKIRKAYSLAKSGMSEELYHSSLFWNCVLWYLGMFSLALLAVTGSVPVTVSGECDCDTTGVSSEHHWTLLNSILLFYIYNIIHLSSLCEHYVASYPHLLSSRLVTDSFISSF